MEGSLGMKLLASVLLVTKAVVEGSLGMKLLASVLLVTKAVVEGSLGMGIPLLGSVLQVMWRTGNIELSIIWLHGTKLGRDWLPKHF